MVDEEKEQSEDNTFRQSRRSFILTLLFSSIVALVGSLGPMSRILFPTKTNNGNGTNGNGNGTNGNGNGTNGVDENLFTYRQMEGTWFSDKAGQVVRVEDFEVGTGASVLWRGNINAVLIKADPDKLELEEGTEQGFVAFCAKCTHLCCEPSYRVVDPDMDNMFCWCHEGIYTPYEVIEDEYQGVVYYGAKVVGGPPPRALPQIPVTIKDGMVRGDPAHLEWYEYCGPMV